MKRKVGGDGENGYSGKKNGGPPEEYRLNIATLNRQGCNISHFTKSHSTL